MKTIEMEVALMKSLDFRQNLIVPNIGHMSNILNFEADLLVLSKSNYATGIEIKVSKSDLKADLKKCHIKNLNSNWRSYDNKCCLDFYYDKFKFFFYAVPEYLKETALELIPDFA